MHEIVTDAELIRIMERRGYVVRGLPDRVAQVDEQLELHGYTPPAAAPDGDQ